MGPGRGKAVQDHEMLSTRRLCRHNAGSGRVQRDGCGFPGFWYCDVLISLLLSGGLNLTTTVLASWTISVILFRNSRTPGGPAAVSCGSFIRVGSVGPNSADEFTEYLTLAGVLISPTPLTGTSLSCEKVELCETGSKAWAVNLPWLSELELWEIGTLSGYVDLTLPRAGGANPGWYCGMQNIIDYVVGRMHIA